MPSNIATATTASAADENERRDAAAHTPVEGNRGAPTMREVDE